MDTDKEFVISTSNDNPAAGIVLLDGNTITSLFNLLQEIKQEVSQIKLNQARMELAIERIEGKLLPSPATATNEPSSPLTVEAFVTVKDVNGQSRSLCLPKNVLQQCLKEKNERPVVRILLTFLYDIESLRKMTLSGKAKSKGEEGSSSYFKECMQVPPIDVKLIQAAILKFFKIPKDVPEDVKAKMVTQKEKETNESITKILQYFRDEYDENGKKKVSTTKPGKSVKRKKGNSPLEDAESNGDTSASS